MADEWTAEEQEKVAAEVRKRATIDRAFRDLCLKDPNAAVEKVSGKAVPEGLMIRFVESEGAHLVVVLPDMVDEGELSDQEIEEVAGGGRCAASCAASCAVTSTVTVGVPGVGGAGCL